MIFVTVGTQLPFDRLVSVVDRWAEGVEEKVFAQVGPTNAEFPNLETAPFLSPVEVAAKFDEATCVIAHAGMGTIFSALAARKPLLVLPRRGDLGEHRNDHQMATARRLGERGLVTVSWTVEELADRLNDLSSVRASPAISEQADDYLLGSIREFLGF